MEIKPKNPPPKEGIPKAAQKELTDLLGEKNVCFNRDLLSVYRGAGREAIIPGAVPPHGMVLPTTVEDIQGIIKIANKYKVPLMAVGAGGPVVCLEGGLVVDTYTKMQKIHQIDPESGYALIEPGVTCGQLLHALRPLGYWVSYGSYPAYIGSLASLVCTRAQTNIMGKEDDFVIGVEVVLPTGEIIRTGTAGLGYDWWTQYRGIPDLTSLWSPSVGTMGIITKAAIRIHPLGETQALVIGGFNNFSDAIEFTHRISKETLPNCAEVWNYRQCKWYGYITQAKGYMEFFNQLLTLKPWEAPEGFYNDYAFASISGYKEQVEGSVKASERIIKELGGEVITDKFKTQFPGCWTWWKHHFLDHTNPPNLPGQNDGAEMSGVGGLITEIEIETAKKLQPAIIRGVYEKFGIRHIRYYCRQMDHGRTTQLRFFWFKDIYDQETLDWSFKKQMEVEAWVTSDEFKKEFPNIWRHHPVPTEGAAPGEAAGPDQGPMPPPPPPPSEDAPPASPYNFADFRKKIVDIIDPNNIMDPGGKKLEAIVWRQFKA